MKPGLWSWRQAGKARNGFCREARRIGLETAINPVDIGVRVELPAAVVEPLTRIFYEAKLVYYSKTFNDRVRTFCMNPNGEVVLENNDGLVTVNKVTATLSARPKTQILPCWSARPLQNPSRIPLPTAGTSPAWANVLGGGVIIQSLGDLLSGHRSTVERLSKCMTIPTLHEATPGDLSLVFPYRHLMGIVEMLEALNQIAPGVYSRYTTPLRSRSKILFLPVWHCLIPWKHR